MRENNEFKGKKLFDSLFFTNREQICQGKNCKFGYFGYTELVAKIIQEVTEGYIFQIDPLNSYPSDYTETTEVAAKELSDNTRPELSNHLENMDSYDVVFLGYPNWWGTMPMAVLLS